MGTPADRFRSSLAAGAEVGSACTDALRRSANTSGGGITPMSPPPPPPNEKKESIGKLSQLRDRLLPPAVSPRIPIRSTATNIGRSSSFPASSGGRSLPTATLQPTSISLQASPIDLKSHNKLPTPRGNMRLDRSDITGSGTPWETDRRIYQNRVSTLESEIEIAKDASKRLAAEDRTLAKKRASSAHANRVGGPDLVNVKETNSVLQGEVNQLKEELRVLKNESYETERSSSTKLRNEILSLQAKVVSSQDKITSLQSELHEERSSSMKFRREHQKLNEENSHLTDTNTMMLSKLSGLDNLRNEQQTLTEESVMKSKQIKDLESQLQSARETKLRNTRNDSEIQTLKELLEGSERKEAAIRIEKEEVLTIMETTVSDKEKEISDLREIRVRHEKSEQNYLERIQTLEEEIANKSLLVITISQRESEIISLNEELSAKEKLYNQTTENCDNLTKQNNELQQQINYNTTEHQHLVETHNSLEEQHRLMNNELQLKKNSIDDLTKTTLEDKSQIDSLKERLGLFESGEIATTMEKDKQIQQLEEDYISATNKLNTISNLKVQLESAVEESNSQLTCKSDQINILEQKLAKHETESSEVLKKLNSDLILKSEKLASVELELEEYARKVVSATAEISTLSETTTVQSEKVASLTSELDDCSSKLQLATTETLTLKDELLNSNDIQVDLNLQKEKVTILTSKLDECATELNTATEEVLKLKTELSDSSSMKTNLDLQTEKVATLRIELESATAEQKTTNENLLRVGAEFEACNAKLLAAEEKSQLLTVQTDKLERAETELQNCLQQIATLTSDAVHSSELASQVQELQQSIKQKELDLSSVLRKQEDQQTSQDTKINNLTGLNAELEKQCCSQTERAVSAEDELKKSSDDWSRQMTHFELQKKELQTQYNETLEQYETLKGFDAIRDTEVSQLKEDIRFRDQQIRKSEDALKQHREQQQPVTTTVSDSVELKEENELLKTKLAAKIEETEIREEYFMSEHLNFCTREIETATRTEEIVQEMESCLVTAKNNLVKEERRAYNYKKLAEENDDACSKRELHIAHLENEIDQLKFNSETNALELQKEAESWEEEYLKMRDDSKSAKETIKEREATIREKEENELKALGKVETLTNKLSQATSGATPSQIIEQDIYAETLTAKLEFLERESETATTAATAIEIMEQQILSSRVELVKKQQQFDQLSNSFNQLEYHLRQTSETEDELKRKIAHLFVENNKITQDCEDAQRDAVTFATRCGQLEKMLMVDVDGESVVPLGMSPNPPAAPPVRDVFERSDRSSKQTRPLMADSDSEFGTCASTPVSTPIDDPLEGNHQFHNSLSVESFTALEKAVQIERDPLIDDNAVGVTVGDLDNLSLNNVITDCGSPQPTDVLLETISNGDVNLQPHTLSESPSLSIYAESDTVDPPSSDYFSIPGTGIQALCEGTNLRGLSLLSRTI